MQVKGDCFIVQAPNCVEKAILFGRNSLDAESVGIAQEIILYDEIKGQNDGGVHVERSSECLRTILQKPRPGIFGGDCGANEKHVSVAITWSSGETECGKGFLLPTDILRYVLSSATTAAAAVNEIGQLVEAHGSDTAKFNFVVCDTAEVWNVSCAGKLMAAQIIKDACRRLPSDGLAIQAGNYEKCTENLAEKLKSMGNEDFAAAFDAVPIASVGWCGPEPIGDGSYSLQSMFDTLRAAAKADESRSATVFVLNGAGISCYWFTGTPNAMESVFKPFVFATNSKISPLTQVAAGDEQTRLHKLHAQRKPVAIENLKELENACVEEVFKYLVEHPVVDDELDELLKDCVEAEVKFYR